MATDFAVFLHRFLSSHMAGLRGCSPNTITSYRDTFKILIGWFAGRRSVPPEKLTLDHIDAAAVTDFLGWLETGRHNCASTRNQRLAAITSFFRWLQSQEPARMAACQEILAIPAKAKTQPGVPHLTVAQTRQLLAAPDRSTRRGRRDATLLATLYETAARVSELAGLAVRDIRLESPPLAVLTGKGRKTRHVPLGASAAALLGAYLAENSLDKPGHHDHPLFFSQHHTRLSRGGIAWITAKYHTQAGGPAAAGTCHPHILSHALAGIRRAAALHPRPPRTRRAIHHRDLRPRLHRSQTQSPRSRLHRHRHRRPARMEPRPRTAHLARQPVNPAAEKGYAQRSTASVAVTRANGTALRITRHCS